MTSGCVSGSGSQAAETSVRAIGIDEIDPVGVEVVTEDPGGQFGALRVVDMDGEEDVALGQRPRVVEGRPLILLHLGSEFGSLGGSPWVGSRRHFAEYLHESCPLDLLINEDGGGACRVYHRLDVSGMATAER